MKKIYMLGALMGMLFSAKAQNADTTHTLLWKVSGNKLARPSYIFGTMHILCADDAKLSDTLKAVIKNTDAVYFEINLDDMKGMLASIQYMRMNDGKKLSDVLSPTDFEKVKNYFTAHAPVLPFSMLERFKPLLISSLIEEQGLDCKATNGMEMVIMKEAHAQQKLVDGLETASFQASLLDSIPYEKQAKDLVNYIDSAEQYKKATSSLADVYKSEDLQAIEALTVAGDVTVSGYLDLLLYGRNRNWAKQLPPIMANKSLLIAVGAAHLPGEKGILQLLRKLGYKVEPVKQH